MSGFLEIGKEIKHLSRLPPWETSEIFPVARLSPEPSRIMVTKGSVSMTILPVEHPHLVKQSVNLGR